MSYTFINRAKVTLSGLAIAGLSIIGLGLGASNVRAADAANETIFAYGRQGMKMVQVVENSVPNSLVNCVMHRITIVDPDQGGVYYFNIDKFSEGADHKSAHLTGSTVEGDQTLSVTVDIVTDSKNKSSITYKISDDGAEAPAADSSIGASVAIIR